LPKSSQENQFLKSNLSGTLSLSSRRGDASTACLIPTQPLGWMGRSHFTSKLFPLHKICSKSVLSLSHTQHTHKIHHLFYKIPTPNSTGKHNLDKEEEEEEGIEP